MYQFLYERHAMKLNRFIDHTCLAPNATKRDIERLCTEAVSYSFKTVAINGCWVSYAAQLLQGSNVGISACIGFPLGAMTSQVKAYEAREAAHNGATEIDMVINIGLLKDKAYDECIADIKAVVDAAQLPVKVILECCLLTSDEIVQGCMCARNAGAAFVKTSTGFSAYGARVADVALMKKTVGDALEVKAAGGIHSADEARAMIEAGASRIGASASCKICSKD